MARNSRNGAETVKSCSIFNLNGTLTAAAFEDGEVGKPESLFDTAIVNPEENALEWVVRADGQRFIVSVPADDSAIRRIRVVVDWASRLK